VDDGLGRFGRPVSNAFLWLCESARAPTGWTTTTSTMRSLMDSRARSPGTFEALHLHTLVRGLPWDRLVPAGLESDGPPLITSGKGGARSTSRRLRRPREIFSSPTFPPKGSGHGASRSTCRGCMPVAVPAGMTRARAVDASARDTLSRRRCPAGDAGGQRLGATTGCSWSRHLGERR